jgi:2-amino-4-hydroxy-6-hydroxymethyldihydropteridine diphosphokinase
MTSLVAIALGSNLGDSLSIVQSALDLLDSQPMVKLIKCSRWYRTKAITLPDSPPQPDYINGCAIFTTSLNPLDLLSLLLWVEKQFGRERRTMWSARTLDLDLLLYDDQIIDLPNLCVPHPRMGDRSFVLLPLQEIAPDWRHPVNGLTIGELAKFPKDLLVCQPQVIVPLKP